MKTYKSIVAGFAACAAFGTPAAAQTWMHYGNQTYGPSGTYSSYGNQTYGPSGTYSTYGNITYGPK